MRRSFWKQVATLFAGMLALPLAAPPPAHAARTDVVYAACYLFSSGGDHTAISFPPHKMTAGELYNMYPEAQLQDEKTGLARANGYYSARCNSFETPEKAEAWYVASGYRMVKRLDYPKGFWPGDKPPAAAPSGPRPPVWVSCGYDAQDGSHALTPAFLMDDPGGNWTTWDWAKQMNAQTDSQRSSMLSCKTAKTREEAEADRQNTIDFYRGRRNIVTLSPPPGARFSGGATASASPARAAPKPASSTGSLTVKTDTSLRDAGKAWDEQVKKTLAAEAQQKVERAAKQAQSDAELKAGYEAFFAERRKQGRAQ